MGSRWVWNRGKRYHVMAKLDPVKISWIIKQKQDGISNDAIADTMKISAVWVKKLWARYRKEGAIPRPTARLSGSFELFRTRWSGLRETLTG